MKQQITTVSGAPRGSRDTHVATATATATATAVPPPAITAFADLDMPPALLAALRAEGITVPFPIQAATLPDALAGRDVLGRGRTGSGKTLAYGLATVARTAGRRAEARRPLALVLVPTRELALQVAEALAPYARALHLRTATVVGGVPIRRQAAALCDGAEVVIATPGRLKDLVTHGECRLDQVGITVLDEADQMTELGFLPQVVELLGEVAPHGQRMWFSATLDPDVGRQARGYLDDPVVHSVDPAAGTVSTMHHCMLRAAAAKQAATMEIAVRDGRRRSQAGAAPAAVHARRPRSARPDDHQRRTA